MHGVWQEEVLCPFGIPCIHCSLPPSPSTAHYRCSATTMPVYQVQSGRMDATQTHRHRERLLGVAAAFQACCASVAACLESNAPIGGALAALEQLHAAFVSLGEVAGSEPADLWAQQGSLAFSSWFSLVFGAAARVSWLGGWAELAFAARWS